MVTWEIAIGKIEKTITGRLRKGDVDSLSPLICMALEDKI